jgi:transcriptional regulator with XRE-family HTH domain
MHLPMRVTLKGRFVMETEKKEIDFLKMGVRIKAFRADKGFSQEDLASAVDVDIHHIASIENGRRNPSLKLLIKIANALRVSADDILSDSLDYSKSTAGTEVHSILMDCNQDEMKMLIKTLHFMMALFSEFGV